jgi:hypothetical protein
LLLLPEIWIGWTGGFICTYNAQHSFIPETLGREICAAGVTPHVKSAETAHTGYLEVSSVHSSPQELPGIRRRQSQLPGLLFYGSANTYPVGAEDSVAVFSASVLLTGNQRSGNDALFLQQENFLVSSRDPYSLSAVPANASPSGPQKRPWRGRQHSPTMGGDQLFLGSARCGEWCQNAQHAISLDAGVGALWAPAAFWG